MARTSHLRWVVHSCLLVVLGLAVAHGWSRPGQPPREIPGEDPRFTGKSASLDAAGLAVSRRHFEAGARAAWHTHDKGQLLFVEAGRARLQRRGEPVKEMGPNESDYTPPSVPHWHGGTPARALTQVSLTFGGETRWLEKVTDAEYGALAAAAGGRVFELRTYTAAPGKLDALHARFRNHTNRFFARHGMSIIGYWVPADVPDTLVYLLAYPDRGAREAAWTAFGADPEWLKARKASETDGRLTAKVESMFLTATDYSPMR